jgi:uncharacterized protein (TIGR00730 family)
VGPFDVVEKLPNPSEPAPQPTIISGCGSRPSSNGHRGRLRRTVLKMKRDAEAMPAERAVWFREQRDLERQLRFIQEEFRAGFELVASIDRPAVSIFGSARTLDTDPWTEHTERLAAGFAREGWAVVTGGGPGLMAAANRGAKLAGGLSVGLGITLPHEQLMNEWLDLSYEFTHFYARKVCFVKASEGFVAAPGGWGTNDELFEALVLIQTRTIRHFPVVLFGADHWRPFLRWSRDLRDHRLVSAADLDLLTVTDDPDEAVRLVLACYRRECDHVEHA